MRSLRVKIAVLFGVTFLLLTAGFVFFTYQVLLEELTHKTWQKDYPDHPDWKLHGSATPGEVRDIEGEMIEGVLEGTLPMVILAVAIGYWLARKTLRPIASVNKQLLAKTPANLGEPIRLDEVDVEFRDLLAQLNALLARLNTTFKEMNEFSAKVAHELRTPLAILRLKIEQADGAIKPELAEELQFELHHLAHVVDQSLMIARAEQGRVVAQLQIFDLVELARDVTEDFSLIARETPRQMHLELMEDSVPVLADPRHVRQIIYNLMTNAWKHGSGDIWLRIKTDHQSAVHLLVANAVAKHPSVAEKNLGLGLRVISSLLKFQPGIKYRRHAGTKLYAVHLSFQKAAHLTHPLLGAVHRSN